MENNSWINHPKLKSIAPEKLMFLMQLYNQAGSKSMNEMLPFLLASASAIKQSGISFSSDEFQLIFDVLKQGKSEEEIQRMNKMIQMFQMMNSGK